MSKKMSPKRLLTTLLIVFSTLSFIKLLIITSSGAGAAPPARRSARGSPAPPANSTSSAAAADVLTEKEFAVVKKLVAGRAPCRLLVFGLTAQLLELARLNAGGATAFLEDDGARRLGLGRAAAAAAARVYRVRYGDAAGEAYALLRHARASPACRRPAAWARCRLAMAALPEAVLGARWDVVVVDGPSGGAPGEPGRMGPIYTAAALARATAAAAGSAAADVVVHDVHRTIERWYAWEFLCDENLAAAKGRLWHFRIRAGSTSDEFCSKAAVQIQ